MTLATGPTPQPDVAVATARAKIDALWPMLLALASPLLTRDDACIDAKVSAPRKEPSHPVRGKPWCLRASDGLSIHVGWGSSAENAEDVFLRLIRQAAKQIGEELRTTADTKDKEASALTGKASELRKHADASMAAIRHAGLLL